MTTKNWILLILFITGLVILLLPDTGKAIIAFNEKHGPSLLDLIGLLLMLTSWVLSCIVIIEKWKMIKLKIRNPVFGLLILCYILALVGIALSLLFTSDVLLWTCAGIAGLINILFVAYAFYKD